MKPKTKSAYRIFAPLVVIAMLIALVAGALTIVFESSPAYADPGAGLSVEVKTYSDPGYTTEASSFCVGNNIYVKATVSNPGVPGEWGDDVSAGITWDPAGGCSWVAGDGAVSPHTQGGSRQ
jgi:hypothetical protein